MKKEMSKMEGTKRAEIERKWKGKMREEETKQKGEKVDEEEIK